MGECHTTKAAEHPNLTPRLPNLGTLKVILTGRLSHLSHRHHRLINAFK